MCKIQKWAAIEPGERWTWNKKTCDLDIVRSVKHPWKKGYRRASFRSALDKMHSALKAHYAGQKTISPAEKERLETLAAIASRKFNNYHYKRGRVRKVADAAIRILCKKHTVDYAYKQLTKELLRIGDLPLDLQRPTATVPQQPAIPEAPTASAEKPSAATPEPPIHHNASEDAPVLPVTLETWETELRNPLFPADISTDVIHVTNRPRDQYERMWEIEVLRGIKNNDTRYTLVITSSLDKHEDELWNSNDMDRSLSLYQSPRGLNNRATRVVVEDFEDKFCIVHPRSIPVGRNMQSAVGAHLLERVKDSLAQGRNVHLIVEEHELSADAFNLLQRMALQETQLRISSY